MPRFVFARANKGCEVLNCTSELGFSRRVSVSLNCRLYSGTGFETNGESFRQCYFFSLDYPSRDSSGVPGMHWTRTFRRGTTKGRPGVRTRVSGWWRQRRYLSLPKVEESGVFFDEGRAEDPPCRRVVLSSILPPLP